jgi:hypothetical protein
VIFRLRGLNRRGLQQIEPGGLGPDQRIGQRRRLHRPRWNARTRPQGQDHPAALHHELTQHQKSGTARISFQMMPDSRQDNQIKPLLQCKHTPQPRHLILDPPNVVRGMGVFDISAKGVDRLHRHHMMPL